MLTRDGVGVKGGGFLSGAAARRFRRGVAGASGFLKAASLLVAVEDLTLPDLGFFGAAASATTSALRFFVELVELSGDVVVALTFLVERRRDIMTKRSPSMHQGNTARCKQQNTKLTCCRLTGVLDRGCETDKATNLDAFWLMNHMRS